MKTERKRLEKDQLSERLKVCLKQMHIARNRDELEQIKVEVKGIIEVATMTHGFQFADELQSIIDLEKEKGLPL